MKITAEMFKKATGVDPEQDDLERCNCDKAGQTFHMMCGWDRKQNRPKFWPKQVGTSSAEQQLRTGRTQMKLFFSKKVYDQFSPEDRQNLTPFPCECVSNNEAEWDCDSCEGGGAIYQHELSAEESAGIQENLRSQGFPLGKIGTN